MPDSQLFDYETCPMCGADIIETDNWATVWRCPEGHFSRQTDYKGETIGGAYERN